MATIRNYQPQDLAQVVAIFNHYVKNDTCTFQIELLTLEEMADKAKIIQKSYPFLVLVEEGEVLGFAYGSRWRAKEAYDLSVETTIYIKFNTKSKGLGFYLYKNLIESLKLKGFHLLVAGINQPNPASVKIHEQLGFEKVGEFRQAGRKFNQWHNVEFWQKLLI